MKILFDIEPCFLNTTGMARVTRELLRGLTVLDTDNTYVLFHSSNFSSSHYGCLPDLPENFEVLRLSRSRRTLTMLSLVGGLLGFGERFLRDDFPDDIDVYFSTTAFLLPVRVPRKIGMIHDLSPFDCPTYFPWRDMLIGRRSYSMLVKSADRILTVSQFSRRKILDKWKLPEDRVGVVDGGVWPASTLNGALDGAGGSRPGGDVPAKYGIQGPYFLWCGAMWKRKNVTALIRALKEFKRRTGDDTLLVLAGTPGNQSAEVDALAKELDVEKYIRRVGFVEDEDLPGLLRGAVAFVFPSMYEGFGLPVLEAMACGTPVIASNVTSLPEVMAGAGLLVDPTAPSTIADSMVEVSTDPDLRRRLSEQGKARAATYSWNASAKALLQAFDEVCSA
ncbi:MAG: glycosyltransferase family 4 protein [Chloroflexi bacterium]|nr:glycosyltransferase family 4 protein [Chloroflexota bacterium]